MKRKLKVSIILVLLTSFTTQAKADTSQPTINVAYSQYKYWDVPLSALCKRRVDQPHISKHVKGTVNIVLSINCPKEFLSVTGILFRFPTKLPSDMRIGHKSGRDKIKMNLAIPCISNEGLSVHTYYVTATFIATGHFPVVKTFSWPVLC